MYSLPFVNYYLLNDEAVFPVWWRHLIVSDGSFLIVRIFFSNSSQSSTPNEHICKVESCFKCRFNDFKMSI